MNRMPPPWNDTPSQPPSRHWHIEDYIIWTAAGLIVGLFAGAAWPL